MPPSSRVAPVMGLVLMLALAIGIVAINQRPDNEPDKSSTPTTPASTSPTAKPTPAPEAPGIRDLVKEKGREVVRLEESLTAGQVARIGGVVARWTEETGRAKPPLLALGKARLEARATYPVVLPRLFISLASWQEPWIDRAELSADTGALTVQVGTAQRRLIQRAIPIVERLSALPHKRRIALDVVTVVSRQPMLRKVYLAEGAVDTERTREVLAALERIVGLNPGLTMARNDSAIVTLYLDPKTDLDNVWTVLRRELGDLDDTSVEAHVGGTLWTGNPRGEPQKR